MAVGAEKRIKWKGSDLGDYGFITFSYQGNNDVRIIPRAKGVKIRGTDDLGGGVLNITANCFVAKSNRTELETFFYNLDSNFSLTESGTLTVTDSNGIISLTDCYLESYSQSSEDFSFLSFNFNFIKSL